MEKAFLSQGFVTDVVPGFVMSFLMGQMKLMALPIQMALGDSYDESTLKEELVVIAEPEPADWAAIHPTIKCTKKLATDLFLLEVPTFKAMTVVLSSLATTVSSSITICTISYNAEVQVRVTVPLKDADKLEIINERQGCELMFKYAFPSDPKTLLASVGVETPFLLDFIRFCKKSGIEVVQVYDFF